MFSCGDQVQIQCRLLAESKLTFNKALEIAQGLESAAKNMKELIKGASREASPTLKKCIKLSLEEVREVSLVEK